MATTQKTQITLKEYDATLKPFTNPHRSMVYKEQLSFKMNNEIGLLKLRKDLI
jgi:hypothetical protein